jgi:uncharacterized protein (DUF2252 family)
MARPTTICNTAREIEVAMYLARANTVIKSLKKAAPPAVPVAIQNEFGQDPARDRASEWAIAMSPVITSRMTPRKSEQRTCKVRGTSLARAPVNMN